jgi:hypothetical protein
MQADTLSRIKNVLKCLSSLEITNGRGRVPSLQTLLMKA